VLHALGLAIGRGDAAAVEMVATDHDRRGDLAAAYHLVEREAEAVTLPEPDPANPRWQALEGDPLASHVEPTVEMQIVGDQFLHLGVGAVDVLGIAAECRPAEWPDAAAEERANIGWHKAGKVEGVGDAL